MVTYHIQDVVVPFSMPEKMEDILNGIPGTIVSIVDTYRDDRGLPDNWRIIWVSEE